MYICVCGIFFVPLHPLNPKSSITNHQSSIMFGIFNDNFPPILDGVGMTAQNYA